MKAQIVENWPGSGGTRRIEPGGKTVDRSLAAFLNTLARLVPAYEEAERLGQRLVRNERDETTAAFLHHVAVTTRQHRERVCAILSRYGAAPQAGQGRGLWGMLLQACGMNPARQQMQACAMRRVAMLTAAMDESQRARQDDVTQQLQALLTEEQRQLDWFKTHDEEFPQ